MRIRTISGKILFTFLVTIISGILIISIFSVISASSFSSEASDRAGNFILQEGLDRLNRSAGENARIVDLYFDEYISEVQYLSNYASDLFNGRIVAEPRKSYYGALSATSNKEKPPMFFSEKHNLEISTEYSGWFRANTNNVELETTPDEWATVNISSNLDFAWRTIFEQNPNFLWSYMGFEKGIHRTYPYKDLDSWRTKEFANARDGGTVVGYDPRIRGFYVNAKNAGTLVIPKPQEDPTLGILKISISSPVYFDNGSLIGVVGADLTIDDVQNTISNVNFGDSGYAFIIDKEGYAVFHKDIDRKAGSQQIIDLEYPSDKTGSEKFSSIVNNMKGMQEGMDSFTKNGETWQIAYYPIPSAGFSLGVVVPKSEILQPANNIRSTILGLMAQQILVFAIIIIVLVAIMYITVKYFADRVVKPIKELTTVTEEIARGNLNASVSGGGGGAREITVLYNNFKGLVTALRFGNESYYAGNLQRALENYQSAMELFKTLGNKKGQGICYNNIGNIYKSQGNLKDANAQYRESIKIANELLETAEGSERTELLYALASRYNNLGLLYKDIEQYDRAIEFLEKALEYDRQIDNSRGFATRIGNMGLVYLAQGKLKEAKAKFDEAYDLVSSLQSDRGRAYATMNYGLYYRKSGDLALAEEKFLDAIQIAEDLDVRVVMSSLKNLQEIYTETNRIELADQIEKRLRAYQTKTSLKEVAFVLDYSGSMAGKRIRAAVGGMKNIFVNQVNDEDVVSLIVFSNKASLVIPRTKKGGNERLFVDQFSRLYTPAGGTAFYDALSVAIDEVKDHYSNGDRWIIALTDGEDNSSSIGYRALLSKIENLMGINVVIIGVGKLDTQKLEKLCEASDKGKFIDVRSGVADAITEAFEEVTGMLTEVEVEGFTPDF